MGQFSMEISWATGSVLGGNQHADFFYRHLVDGDAASNPLGWRWAAGIHTRGKLAISECQSKRHTTPAKKSGQFYLYKY